MKEIIKSIFRIDILGAVIYLILGMILYTLQGEVLETISIIIGIFLIVAGVIPLVNYFKGNRDYFKATEFLAGILLLSSGVFLIANKSLLETIIAVIIGVILIINSVSKIEYSLTLRDNNVNEWIISMIFSIITLLIGIFFVINSFKAIDILAKTLGLIIIIYAIIDIIEIIVLKIKFKKVLREKTEFKEEVIKVIEAK